MATNVKKTFPMLPVSYWWKLRDKFKSSIPGVVTDSYLATILNIKANSAQTNVLPALKQIELIDEDGKTKDIVKDWRDDQKYPDVCKKLAKKIYPQELFDAFPDPIKDKNDVARWFAHITGTGKIAVNKMVAFYILLVEANPAKHNLKKTKTIKTPKKTKTQKQQTKKKNDIIKEARSHEKTEKSKPDININLQIHISADATPDQIEKIFESMSKYIYRDDQ